MSRTAREVSSLEERAQWLVTQIQAMIQQHITKQRRAGIVTVSEASLSAVSEYNGQHKCTPSAMKGHKLD